MTSSLPAIINSKKPMAWLSVAFSTCLHLFLLNFAEARMLPSNSSSCYSRGAPGVEASVTQHLHHQLMQLGASNFQGLKPLNSRQPHSSLGKLFNHSKIQVPRKAGVDSSRESYRDDHIQNTTRIREIGLMMGKLGSTPPSCVMRCAGCVPCEPVHVPIQRGRKRIGLLEYYPEAWRCKCKNKLYMPGSSTVP